MIINRRKLNEEFQAAIIETGNRLNRSAIAIKAGFIAAAHEAKIFLRPVAAVGLVYAALATVSSFDPAVRHNVIEIGKILGAITLLFVGAHLFLTGVAAASDTAEAIRPIPADRKDLRYTRNWGAR
ncbi:MAG: hypothetical protein P4M13_04040 [Alphaproteobacteria bacterium]|nr:hypothetical protein [Alphaproteobacteria bacterium]